MIAPFFAPMETLRWSAALGADRARFLHAMLSNTVLGVESGHGNHAVLLTAKGKMVADVHVLVCDDEILLGAHPEAMDEMLEMLDRYIVTEEVTLERRQLATLTVVGDPAAGIAAGIPEGDHRHGPITIGETTVRAARLGLFVEPSVELIVPEGELPAVRSALRAAGLEEGDGARVETLRIESATPLWGAELDEGTIPLEAGLDHALDLLKGCYIGQETIVRVLTRGHVNWHVRGLRIEGEAVPKPGTEVVDAEGRRRGEIRSAVRSPRYGVIALARYGSRA